MPWAWKRDPITGDLIPDGKGGYVKTNTAEVLVQNQLLAHYGKAWQDPELGSMLHDLERFKTSPEVLVPEEARRALARVEAAGRISNIETDAELRGAGRVDVATRFRDTSSNQIVDTYVTPGR
ncbi:MAG: hypothetical protein M3619_00595 [Myxococcota bacterium]|nr:hypothetical protein [Myxococcota bacterium]